MEIQVGLLGESEEWDGDSGGTSWWKLNKTENDNWDSGGTLVVKVKVKTENDNGDSSGTP